VLRGTHVPLTEEFGWVTCVVLGCSMGQEEVEQKTASKGVRLTKSVSSLRKSMRIVLACGSVA
jgi:hypothetical protein